MVGIVISRITIPKMSQYAHLSDPDPELLAAFNAWTGDARDAVASFTTIASAREKAKAFIGMIMDYHRPHLPPDEKYRMEDHKLSVFGGEITVRVLTPRNADNSHEQNSFPLLLWMHGGGWGVSNIDQDDFYLRRICVDLQMCILNVDYRLAPEYPFPTGLDDCYSALKWAAANSSFFNVDLSRGFLVAGQSSGSNFAAAIAHRAVADPFFSDKPVTGHVLQLALVCHPDAYPPECRLELISMEQNKDAPFLRKEHMLGAWERYGGSPTDPDVSPLLYKHEGLSPMYAQVCGWDVLRDEGLLYEKLVREAGVQTKVDVYPGAFHGFSCAFSDVRLGVRFDREFREGIRWLLSLSKKDVQ